MKKIKFLTSLTALGMTTMPFVALTSCNNSNISIKFECSEGVALVGGNSTISCAKGTTWKDLLAKNLVPQVSVQGGYASLEWCIESENDYWESVTDSYIFDKNCTVYYVAYETASHPAMEITLDYSPEGSEPVAIEFAQNFTFETFRHYMQLAKKPEIEGYTFDRYDDGNGNVIQDSDLLTGTDKTVKLKWTINSYDATIKSDGNGTVSIASKKFNYGTKWGDIKEGISVTPNLGYRFDKWVDTEGDDILDTYEMKESFTAIAQFRKVVKRTIEFSCSEGVTLSDYKPIKVEHGITWGELQNRGDIPTPSVLGGWTHVGWITINESGEYQKITSETVITKNMSAKYVAYDPSVYSLTVQFVYGPDATKDIVNLGYIKGATYTFGNFRTYYEIPAKIEYEGYTFDGYYKGATKLTDDMKCFDVQEETITIEAKFIKNKCTINLAAGEHGKVSADSVVVEYGVKFSDAIATVTATPDVGYEFYKWVDGNGNDIDVNAPVKANLVAKALFIENQIKVTKDTKIWGTPVVGFTAETNKHGDCKDVKSSETSRWSESSSGFKEPSLNGNELMLQTKNRSCNLRLVAQWIHIEIPVKPHSTRTTTINMNGIWRLDSNGYFTKTMHQSTLQVFKDTFPQYYSNLSSPTDSRKVADNAIFTRGFRYQELSWGGWSKEEAINVDLATYTDTNNTDTVKYCDHLLLVSFLVEGQKNTNSNKEAYVKLKFTAK